MAGLALFGLLSASACRTPEVLDVPQRAPIPVDASHIPAVALITYAGHVDPARVSDGTFCPHADRALFDSFFSVPEAIFEEELRRAGYPVTEVPAPLAAELADPYSTHVAVTFVGDSRCESRVPLFGPRQAEDCSVRVRVVITSNAADKPQRRAVERIGLSSRLVPVDPVPGRGPTPTWQAAVRDALQQILEDPAAAALLAGGAGSPGGGLR